MPNSKLIEVLQTLGLERESISSRIDDLQRELDVVEEAIQSIKKIADENRASDPDGRKTNIQMVEDILRDSPIPMHILEIVEKIKEIRGVDVSRATIETAISRYLNTSGVDPQIERLGEGMYRHRGRDSISARARKVARRMVRESENINRVLTK